MPYCELRYAMLYRLHRVITQSDILYNGILYLTVYKRVYNKCYVIRSIYNIVTTAYLLIIYAEIYMSNYPIAVQSRGRGGRDVDQRRRLSISGMPIWSI